jgi:DNA polymerase III psi subunit
VADSQESSTKLRDHYLQTLGIVQYVPRDLVQEAVVDSSVGESPVVENAAISQPLESAETTSSQQSTIEALLHSDADDKDANLKKPVKAIERSDKIQQQTDKLTLQFVFWQPTDELLIATAVDHELPDSQQLKLLAKIVTAIDNQVSGLPQYDSVNWPPHSSMQGGEQEAREFLSTLINSKLAAKPTKLLLLLGESAQDWLLSAEQKNSVKDGLAPMNADVTALIAPALNQMLSQPQAKRLTWQAICQHFKHTSVTS